MFVILDTLMLQGITTPFEGKQRELWGSEYGFQIHDIIVEGAYYHIKKCSIAAMTDPYVERCIGLVDVQLLIKLKSI
ncbi:hypothetical protein [Bartonella sp. B1098]|uniref:hypothetical protein n=1 Tax=Bartonella sp. B1098 TaxID=2911421 RepID=UPI0035324AEB